MQRLGMDTMLVCSNVGTATVDDDEVSAAQLRRLGDEAASYGVRLAYEALAWGRFVDDYRRAWRIVELADHPAVGTCLDSFHILSRGHDPEAIERIPGDKIFFVQLADAPALTMDVLSWSRHHPPSPGEGAFDLAAFVGHCLEAGYAGPISLEVFNDTFRQTDVLRTAQQAKRSLTWLEDRVAHLPVDRRPDGPVPLPEVDQPVAFDFVEVKAEDTGEVDVLLRQLGFTYRGRHRSKQVRLWTQGRARVVCNEQLARDLAPTLAAVGFEVVDPGISAERARALDAPAVFRRTEVPDAELPAFRAPDGTEVFLASAADGDAAWVVEFDGGEDVADAPLLTGIDQINLAQPWHRFDEAVLFYSSVLALRVQHQPGRSRLPRGSCGAMLSAAAMGWSGWRSTWPRTRSSTQAASPSTWRSPPTMPSARHEGARARGLRPLPIPANYYDDLVARYDLDREAGRGRCRSWACSTTVTRTATSPTSTPEPWVTSFSKLVQRGGGYQGYGGDQRIGAAHSAQHRRAAVRRTG